MTGGQQVWQLLPKSMIRMQAKAQNACGGGGSEKKCLSADVPDDEQEPEARLRQARRREARMLYSTDHSVN